MSRQGWATVTLRTTDSFWERVKDDADARGMTTAQLVTQVLNEYIAEGGGELQPEPEPQAPRVVRVNEKVFAQAMVIASSGGENLSEVIPAAARRAVRAVE